MVILAAALGYWGFSQLGEKQTEAGVLLEKMVNPGIAALLADPGGVSRANRDALEIQKLEKGLREADGAWTDSWSAETKQMTGGGQVWATDPGKWKDRLIALESDLQKAASASRVQLPPDFYLGLENYRQKNPSIEELPSLALHLSVADRLVRRFFEARKAVEQYPTICEMRSLTGPEPGPKALGEAPARKPAPEAPGVERKTFRLEVRCSPEVMYEYVRLLTLDPALFVLTDLAVINEKQTFPLRSEIGSRLAAPVAAPGAAPDSKKEAKKLLEILAGEESLNVSMVVDFVAWKNPEEGKTGAAPSPPQ